MKRLMYVLAVLVLSLPMLALAAAAAEVFEATGAIPDDIQATVDAFRAFLGTNNGVGGSFPDGRREINGTRCQPPSRRLTRCRPTSLMPILRVGWSSSPQGRGFK